VNAWRPVGEPIDPEWDDDGFNVADYFGTHECICGETIGALSTTRRHGHEPIPMLRLSVALDKQIACEQAAIKRDYEEYRRIESEPRAHVDEWEWSANDRKLTAYWQGRAKEDREWRARHLPPPPTEWSTPSIEPAPGLYWFDAPDLPELVKVRARRWFEPRIEEAPELVELELAVWQNSETNQVIMVPGGARMGAPWCFIVKKFVVRNRFELPRDWLLVT
jgi:hypothetical protein